MSEEIKRGRGRPKKNTTVETNTVQSSPTNSDTTYEFDLYFDYDLKIPKGRMAIIRTIGMKIEDKKVKMYACGITASGDAHIGHAYQAIVFDVIRKYLEYKGYNNQQINIIYG